MVVNRSFSAKAIVGFAILLLAARAEAADYPYSLEHDGLTRTFNVHVPASYDGSHAVALVLDFHGFNGTAAIQASLSGFREQSNTSGFIVAWPQGIEKSWNAGTYCCGPAWRDELDDVGFARAIVAQVAADFRIDRRRVYATGISNGGAMTHRLACEAADLFAAVAPVSYPLAMIPFDTCQPSRPITVIHFHGLDDNLAQYDGVPPFIPAVPDSFAAWASIDGCTGDPETSFTQGESRCETYDACLAGVENTLCSLRAGHIAYVNEDDVDIAAHAWSTLERYLLPLPIAGRRLDLRDDEDPTKRKLRFTSDEAAIDTTSGSGIDPLLNGASLQLFNPLTGESACLRLPAGPEWWKVKGTPPSFSYTDKQAQNGPCKAVKIRNGKLVKVLCQAKAQPLAFSLDEVSQGELAVRFASGGAEYCAVFGGTIVSDSSVEQEFRAHHAPAPLACPVPQAPCP